MKKIAGLMMMGALALGGCAVDDADPVGTTEQATADEVGVDSVPIATVERENGNTVEFFEPRPGMIFFVETGASETLRGSWHSAIDLFHAADPAADVPEALAEADARRHALDEMTGIETYEVTQKPVAGGSGGGGGGGEPAPGPVAAGSGACSTSSFKANHCPGGGDTHWCLTDWHGGMHWEWSRVNYVFHDVCAVQGNITQRLLIDSQTVVSKTVTQGNLSSIGYIHDPLYLPFPPFYLSNRFNFFTDITNASGDTFHSGGVGGDH